MATVFFTASARDRDFTASAPPSPRPYGRVLPDGALIALNGPRHAMTQGQTVCGIPASEVVYLGTAFAPEEPGACPDCLDRVI